MTIFTETFRVAWAIFRAVFQFTFGIGKDSEWYLCGKSLVTSASFRLPNRASTDPFVSLKFLKSMLGRVWKETPKVSVLKDGDGTGMIVSGQLPTEKSRREYLQFMTNSKPGVFVPRTDSMGGRNTLHKILLTGLLLWHFLPIFIVCLFSKHRANITLLMQEFVFLSNLMTEIEERKVKRLYYFNIFVKDANLAALLARRKGVHVTKIASDVPIGFANQILIADTLATCIKYQEEEVKLLPEVRVANIENWLPEHCLDYLGNYDLPAQYDFAEPMTLGYYSSGAWRRAELDHNDVGDGFFEAEYGLLDVLAAYLRSRPEVKLVIFPHPYEKRDEALFARTAAYYEEKFSGIDFQLLDRELGTPTTFHHVDTAISVYSTVSYERLFMGFKSLFYPLGMDEFPLKGTSLEKICPKNPEELAKVLDHNLKLTRKQFYQENGLDGYSVEDYRDRFDFEAARAAGLL